MRDYPATTPQQLGAVLRGHRLDRKLTQQQAGASVGLAQKAVSQLESNPAPASLARVFKLLAALNLEIIVRPRRAAGKSEW